MDEFSAAWMYESKSLRVQGLAREKFETIADELGVFVQSESGYNDVFIPAMQRLSPAYREYHKSLQAANEVFLRHFQQE